MWQLTRKKMRVLQKLLGVEVAVAERKDEARKFYGRGLFFRNFLLKKTILVVFYELKTTVKAKKMSI